MGYRPMLELNSRNQPVAITDCLTRYRESSEFIIIADVDDVLIPKEQNYYKEFSHWVKIYPFAAAFMYYRRRGTINAANSFGNFSLLNTLSSLSIGGENLIGKSVYQTKIAESAWIHWPFFKNETTATIKNGGRMLHVAIDNSMEEKLTIMSHKELKSVTTNFFETFKNFPSFNSNSAYAGAISKCHGESVSWNSTDQPCLTEMRCSKPKIVEGFKCHVAKRNFTSVFLNENIVLHIPYSNYFWEKSENGCNLFVN
uniref:Glycosyltransferase family 92 protein n=1 Tax=Panagrolaimus davidi TaxID=227884 RepID=A0A914Q1T9_9BILA